ncbi:BMC domain-containing protein [Sporomusa malonica]|uniref:Carboxysome shell and ethanolamine utilization microcompartment protein CcmL/EutN n=1 Tax=Sporomusa malonica TaxID=112901 RepID=A0A1W2ERL1_9FIRM|nr:BMC domain-containing protein [Sporomusa malonica]SMD12353.1 Carboxysome shell and ethanolamine utilization microcompartment protein CcmL/EutN [Sporomusa malonica]
MINAIGIVEFTSIAKGIEASDIMAKTADVTLLVAKHLCPGKYMVLVSGDVSSVRQSITAGIEMGAQHTVDHFVIPNVHPSILPAIGGGNDLTNVKAIGIIETYSVAASIEATDVAVKNASVMPVRLHMAFGIGGKSYSIVTGDVAAVNAAVAAGSELAASKGMLVYHTVIPRPNQQVIDSFK